MPARKSNHQSTSASTEQSATVIDTVATTVATTVDAAVVATEAKTRSSQNKRSKASTSVAAATAAATAAASVTESAAPMSPSGEEHGDDDQGRKSKQMSVEDIISQIDEQLTHHEQELARLKERSRLKEVNRVLRDVKRFVTRYDQQQKKMKTKPKQTRKPTGFARPRGLSDEMIQFLNSHAGIKEIKVSRKDDDVQSVKIEQGCKLARNELTKALCDYFKDSNMRKDPEDKRKIFLDDATRKLFRIDLNEFKSGGGTVSETGEPVITYFALQKYLPIHCLKEE